MSLVYYRRLSASCVCRRRGGGTPLLCLPATRLCGPLVAARNVIARGCAARLLSSSSSSSSLLDSLRTDPSKLVHGLTRDHVEKDPAIAEYLRANFPHAFVREDNDNNNKDRKSRSVLPGMDTAEAVDDDSVTETEGSHDGTATGYEKREPESYPRNIRPLYCYYRDPVNEEGSRRCKRLRRRDNMIPGLLYGGDPSLGIYSHQPDSKVFIKTPWNLLQRELDKYHWSFESRVYNLTVLQEGCDHDDEDGVVHRVVPQNVQRHPVQSTIFCANFCRYHAGRPIKLPVQQVNEEESPALKRDGFIIPIQREIECFVEDGVPIPEKLELECTGLRMKDVIRLDRILFPDGVRVSDRVLKRGQDYVVGVVFGASREEDDEEEGVEDAASEEAQA